MIHKIAQINWHEGMFMQPHHFQAADRSLILQDVEQDRAISYLWGISSLNIDKDALEGYRFSIYSGIIRLQDGTLLDIPGNAEVSVKSFQEEMQEADGVLPVWIGVRRPEPHRPAVHQLGEENIGAVRTYIAREISIEDENIGDNEQIIQVKLWNVRIFFGESPGDEYESMKVGEIIRSSQTDLPVMNENCMPPLVSIGAAPAFKEKLKNLVVHLNNQTAFMRRDISEKRSTMASDPANVIDIMLRVQAMASFGMVLGQLQSMDETHPLNIYIELIRLVGFLAPISPDIPLEIPSYNHNNLTEVMDRLFAITWSMLEGGVVPEYVERQFEIKGNSRSCRIDQEWLDNELTVYLCIDTEVAESDLDATLSDMRVKIGPPSTIDALMAERKRGMSCQRIRRVPIGLQDRSGLNYYQLDLTRRSAFWQDLYKDLILEIRGIPENLLPNTKLYVHLEK